VIVLNERAKHSPPAPKVWAGMATFNPPTPLPFSRLPIYRAIRKNFTDDVQCKAILKAVKREYMKNKYNNAWRVARIVSPLFSFAQTPEKSVYWLAINKELMK
jgi:hypothetical protein